MRGTDVFIVQSHTAHGDASINDAVMEHLIMVDAARRASAKRITAVCPSTGTVAKTARLRAESPSPPS